MGGGKRCEECLLYALVCRTPSQFWLEHRDVLRWMRRVGMLRRGAPRERLERGQAPGHSEFAWRNAAGHLACNKPYHCFSKICCATILQYQNTTFISWQQMFLNAETLSMIPGFVREINHAFLWEGIRNGKHAVPAPGSAATAYTLLDRHRLQVRFPVMAQLNWWQTILAAVVASLVAIVVTMLVGWQYTQPIAA